MTGLLTDEEKINSKIYADIEARPPDIVRDIIRVLEWSVSTKTPIGGVAASLERLREIAKKLEAYKRITP